MVLFLGVRLGYQALIAKMLRGWKRAIKSSIIVINAKCCLAIRVRTNSGSHATGREDRSHKALRCSTKVGDRSAVELDRRWFRYKDYVPINVVCRPVLCLGLLN